MLWSANDKTRSCDGVKGNRPTAPLEGETYLENMARISQDRRKQESVGFKA